MNYTCLLFFSFFLGGGGGEGGGERGLSGRGSKYILKVRTEVSAEFTNVHTSDKCTNLPKPLICINQPFLI